MLSHRRIGQLRPLGSINLLKFSFREKKLGICNAILKINFALPFAGGKQHDPLPGGPSIVQFLIVFCLGNRGEMQAVRQLQVPAADTGTLKYKGSQPCKGQLLEDTWEVTNWLFDIEMENANADAIWP